MDNLEIALNQLSRGRIPPKEMFYIGHKPVYTLKECLNLVGKSAFDLIWLNFIFVTVLKKNIDSKAEKIKILERELPKILKKSIEESLDNHVLEGLKENTPCSEVISKYLHIGIQFTFIDKGKKIPVIPNELINVYRQLNIATWRLKKQEEFLKYYLMGSSFIYGVFPKQLLEIEWRRVFCEEFDYEKFHSILEESSVKYDGENYFAVVDLFDVDGLTQEILKIKQNTPYKKMDVNEIMSYIFYMSEQFEIVTERVNLSPEAIIEFFKRAFFLEKLDFEEIKLLMNEFKISEKEQRKIQPYFDNWNQNIRRWLLNGHTIDEVRK